VYHEHMYVYVMLKCPLHIRAYHVKKSLKQYTHTYTHTHTYMQVARGHRTMHRSGSGIGGGIYGLLTAPSKGWEALTEAEIGQEWVQFLIEETEEVAKR
jgi:hypothetical protein